MISGLGGLIARVRSLFNGARNDKLDAEMHAEFAHHIELRAADLVNTGLTPDEAKRQARVEFGGTYNHKEAGRAARGLRWFDAFRISWLDVKLGARMVRRYPGLTIVAGLAMGVAIAIGAGVMGVIALVNDPKIPLHEGERIVGIQVWHSSWNNAERRIAYDLAAWKSELKAVRDIGAFRSAVRAVGANDGRAEPGRGAEMSASGFRVARVEPLLGRYLLDDDERPGAPLVVVLGHEIWSGRFASDSAIIGRHVKIGGVPHMVVGVMPAGFAWPINYNMWLPLRLEASVQPRQGPVLYAFGRLDAGASLEEAATELAAVGERIAKASPETHRRLRAWILPFALSWFELDSPETVLVQRAAQAAVTMLLIIICVNIAILVYARTATRQGEIAVRSALGASRSRIVTQLVGEAMVLAAIGAAVGLTLISIIAGRMDTILSETGASTVIPFWFKVGVSPATIGFLVGLAVLAALIIGVVPALQVTGRRVQASLQRLAGGGGHASLRMGTMWTSLVIVEVALTVAIMPSSAFMASRSLEAMMTGPGFPAEEILMAELSVNREQNEAGPREEDSLYTRRATQLRYEVMRRLQADPNVAAVSFSAGIPGSESSGRIELDTVPVKFESGSSGGGGSWSRWGGGMEQVRFAAVDAAFFDALDVAPIMGRTFTAADAVPHANVAVVNRTFADSQFSGTNPIGRKFRELGNPGMGPEPEYRGPWQEIVGVVPDVPALVDYERPRGVWYAPTRTIEPATLLIHVRGMHPAAFVTRLRVMTASVDEGMFLRRVQPLDEGLWKTHLPMRLLTSALIAVALSVLVLSAAGLYALMSVIVTQRRREIGIRMALGADRGRVLRSIFSRAALQVGAGIALGTAMAVLVLQGAGGEMRGFNAFVILPAAALFMLAVGVLAALGPARRGLAIQPSVVLKED
ncbi:MAG: ABC transporter permease [Gemmatimonadaceae bacterium]